MESLGYTLLHGTVAACTRSLSPGRTPSLPPHHTPLHPSRLDHGLDLALVGVRSNAGCEWRRSGPLPPETSKAGWSSRGGGERTSEGSRETPDGGGGNWGRSSACGIVGRLTGEPSGSSAHASSSSPPPPPPWPWRLRAGEAADSMIRPMSLLDAPADSAPAPTAADEGPDGA